MHVPSTPGEAWVPSWSHYYNFDLSWPRHLANVIQHLPLLLAVRALRPARILEVGSGTGSLAIFMSYFQHQVVSVDLSESVLERAMGNCARLRGRARFQKSDAFDMRELDRDSFDVAVSQGFFEHFDDHQIGALLREQLRVARYAVMSVPNSAYGRHDRGDERLLSRAEWEHLLRSQGLRLVRSSEYRPLSRGAITPSWWRSPGTMYLATIGR